MELSALSTRLREYRTTTHMHSRKWRWVSCPKRRSRMRSMKFVFWPVSITLMWLATKMPFLTRRMALSASSWRLPMAVTSYKLLKRRRSKVANLLKSKFGITSSRQCAGLKPSMIFASSTGISNVPTCSSPRTVWSSSEISTSLKCKRKVCFKLKLVLLTMLHLKSGKTNLMTINRTSGHSAVSSTKWSLFCLPSEQPQWLVSLTKYSVVFTSVSQALSQLTSLKWSSPLYSWLQRTDQIATKFWQRLDSWTIWLVPSRIWTLQIKKLMKRLLWWELSDAHATWVLSLRDFPQLNTHLWRDLRV